MDTTFHINNENATIVEHQVFNFLNSQSFIDSYKALLSAIPDSVRSFIVDLSDVEQLDSAGLAALLMFRGKCKEHFVEQAFVITLKVKEYSQPQAIIEMARFDRLFQLFVIQ